MSIYQKTDLDLHDAATVLNNIPAGIDFVAQPLDTNAEPLGVGVSTSRAAPNQAAAVQTPQRFRMSSILLVDRCN